MEPWRVYLLDRVLLDDFLPLCVVHDVAHDACAMTVS